MTLIFIDYDTNLGLNIPHGTYADNVLIYMLVLYIAEYKRYTRGDLRESLYLPFPGLYGIYMR